MGTNYYLRTNICEDCGRYDETHVGKSSCGWKFSLHVFRPVDEDDEQGPTCLKDWRLLWDDPKNQIWNEYGDQVTPEDMACAIDNRPEELLANHWKVVHEGKTWTETTGSFS